MDIEGLNSQLQENIKAKIKEIQWEKEYGKHTKINIFLWVGYDVHDYLKKYLLI